MGGNTRDGSTPFSRMRKPPLQAGVFALWAKQRTGRALTLRRFMTEPVENLPEPTAPVEPESLRAIFARFLKFGCLAWGGPAAQIAMIKRECVDEEKWISEVTFRKQLAVYQILPGPEAHELCVYFGRLQAASGADFLAGLGFMLPGFILMLGLSVLYVEANLAGHLHALFYGLTAAVGALVARALVRLSKSFISDVPLALLAIAGFGAHAVRGASFVLSCSAAASPMSFGRTGGAG